MEYTRQQDLVDQKKISASYVNIIGCGAVGSATAMALAKMGVCYFILYDEDGVSEVNLPNQMYKNKDLGNFKVDALSEIIKEYNPDAVVTAINKNYIPNGTLTPITIVATDSMHSRKMIWEQFCAQGKAEAYIEARMGAEEGQVYTIIKKYKSDNSLILIPYITDSDKIMYEERLYTDSEAKQAPCTAKAIIYNVFMIASLVCRAYKAVVEEEKFPRELVFGMSNIHKYSFQVRE